MRRSKLKTRYALRVIATTVSLGKSITRLGSTKLDQFLNGFILAFCPEDIFELLLRRLA